MFHVIFHEADTIRGVAALYICLFFNDNKFFLQ